MKVRPTLIRPLYTEKMAGQQEVLNKYAFHIDKDANKIQVKKVVEEKFSVKVKSVNIINVRGKSKQQLTRQGRFSGKRANWKKAIVTLEADNRIELFDNA